jgi:hypothetical protein
VPCSKAGDRDHPGLAIPVLLESEGVSHDIEERTADFLPEREI